MLSLRQTTLSLTCQAASTPPRRTHVLAGTALAEIASASHSAAWQTHDVCVEVLAAEDPVVNKRISAARAATRVGHAGAAAATGMHEQLHLLRVHKDLSRLGGVPHRRLGRARDVSHPTVSISPPKANATFTALALQAARDAANASHNGARRLLRKLSAPVWHRDGHQGVDPRAS